MIKRIWCFIVGHDYDVQKYIDDQKAHFYVNFETITSHDIEKMYAKFPDPFCKRCQKFVSV